MSAIATAATVFAGSRPAGRFASPDRVIFTDLDGTLLHAHTYSYFEAMPGLRVARRQRVPVVFTTSKTRAEVEFWRKEMENRDPFIVENGGAIYVPCGYFPFPLPSATQRDGYDVIELGTPYTTLVANLTSAVRESRCAVDAFHQLTAAEIARRTDLPLQQAEWAKQREFDEVFEIVGDNPAKLLAAIRQRGNRCTQGGRYHHITGGHDKALAVQVLSAFFRRAMGAIVTLGLGDGPNDIGMLNSVDIPVAVGSPAAPEIRRSVPNVRSTRAFGPRGWSEAVLQLLAA